MEEQRLNTSELSLYEEALYQHVYYDQLTGLPSMSHFFELAEEGRNRLLAEGKDPAVLFINLNGMKYFNNKYGFAEGDRLIKSVAQILAHRFSKDCCSRFGQDHFAVCTDANNLDERLYELFNECWRINDGRSLPVHVGVYLNSIEAVEPSAACDRAKLACDLIREAYISSVRYFTNEMLESETRHQYIIDHLDQAIAEGWIQVYYQAIVRASNGRVCDEEALARWIDPQRGFLSPAEFIPTLEGAELIYKLDLHVISQVLAKMKAQAEAGLYVVPQSVNLSRTDFNVDGFVEEIRKRVDAAGIERSKLTLEITESVMGRDFVFMKTQVERLQKLGFKVWMDDFGSGYSSLDVLQNIRFDLIKLDMRFMERFGEREESKIILTELVRMAIGLGIETLAEGVETKEQVDFLREIGCSKIQGFYFTKPVPLDTIMDRKQAGTLIGFENPDEAEYYAAIGRISLYDSSAIVQEDHHHFQQYFDTIPMVVIEVDRDGSLRVTRCNQSYRDYLEHSFGYTLQGTNVPLPELEGSPESTFIDALHQCSIDGDPVILDNELHKDEIAHAIINRIAVNPVTGTAALLVAVMAVERKADQMATITFANVARTLSTDYRYIYYVDLETEQFVEYSSSSTQGKLAVERRGSGFFQASREDSRQILYPEDQASFIRQFTKENVIRSMDKNGAFTTTYRQMVDGKPRYMHLKASRMQGDSRHIIIGVSDIDAQKRQQKAFERLRSEQFAYVGLMALSDEYLVVYVVDTANDHYIEYSAASDFENIGLPKEGDDFFGMVATRSEAFIYEDDLSPFVQSFTKETLLKQTEHGKRCSIDHRIMLQGTPTPVRFKVVQVRDGDAARLIIGVQTQDELESLIC